MKNLNAWLVVLVGVLLVLHAAEVINVLMGAWTWVLAVVVLVIGVLQLKK